MNTALRLSVPTGSVEVWVCAWPLVTVTGLPMSVEPSRNWMLPVADEGVTVAVSVSWVPKSWGLGGETPSDVDVDPGVTVNDSTALERLSSPPRWG